MGTVIALDRYRELRGRPPAPLSRLEDAIARLEPLVGCSPHRLVGAVERELRGIGRAVSTGNTVEAAERAERLADRLEHPAALG
jgi:hypothetical protein